MLHIKDIEAFAHINEALARAPDEARAEAGGDTHRPAAHPALLLAMVATGRLKPDEPGAGDEQAGGADRATARHHHASLAGMMARLLAPRRG